jgi:small-conductance mechanosensitive channel
VSFLTFSESILRYIEEFLAVRIIMLIFILLVLSYIINKIVDVFFRNFHFWDEEVEKTIQGVTRSAIKYMSISLLVLYVIGQFIDVQAVLAGAGILGVVIGFAAQQLLKDVLLGIARLTDNEFRVGNYVTFNGTSSGTVEEIGIRFMKIREWSGKLLTIPHGEIKTIQNFNKGRMRVIERMTVGYQEDPRRIKELLEAVCKVCNEKYSDSLLMLEDGTPEEVFQYVGITDLNPKNKYVGYEFCVKGLVKPEEYFETSRNVRFELMSVFYDHDIQMPASNLLFQGETGNVGASDS